ncbi:MAG: hypothetical protein IJJ48_07560 [Firmicutes bacterium]|nr:hypothetical protein [Bacillota bacterium]
MGSNSNIRPCTIESGYCSDSMMYRITINNVINADDCFDKIIRIMQHYSLGEEYYFGFYRLDGIKMTKEEWIRYDKEIPAYFKQNGTFQEITETVYGKSGREKTYSGYLIVARAKINNDLYQNLQWFFKYYLETVMFVPKISFDIFKEVFSNYMRESTKSYLANNYTDFLYTYYDSGSFDISFDPQKYDVDKVCKYVHSVFGIDW